MPFDGRPTKMEDFSSIWFYEEGMEEVRQKLQHRNFELEAVRMRSEEQARKHKEKVDRLVDLLVTVQKERDEARERLHKLINKPLPSSPSSLNTVMIPGKASSRITESNSLSRSRISSPVDSFFDADHSSPDFSTIYALDGSCPVNQPFVYDCNNDDDMVEKIDPTDAVIEGLAKRRVLPQRGKYLQALKGAPPILQTVVLAGPIPRWRNPPPSPRPIPLPTLSAVGGLGRTPSSSHLEPPTAAGLLRMRSTPVLTCGGAQGLGFGPQNPVAKRQRIQ